MTNELEKPITRDDPDYLEPGEDGGDVCLRKHGLGYRCTRSAGHDGDHAAHNIKHEMLMRWRSK